MNKPPSRPVGTEKDVKYEARPGMLGDSTPPEGNALISSLGWEPIKNISDRVGREPTQKISILLSYCLASDLNCENTNSDT